MADQRAQEIDQRAGDAGHLQQQAEDDEHRHREQLDRGHSLVHLADDDRERNVARVEDVGDRRDAEAEGDRHASEDADPEHADEKHQQIAIAERVEDGLEKPEPEADDESCGEGCGELARRRAREELSERYHQQQRERRELTADLPTVGDLHDRREDRLLLGHVGKARHDDLDREDGDDQRREPRDEPLGSRRQPRHEDGHAHVLAPAQRDRGPEAHQPEKQDCRDFAAPDERLVERVAPNDAREQDADLDDHQSGRDALRHPVDDDIEPPQHAGRSTAGRLAPRCLTQGGLHSGHQASEPVYCCSADHRAGPNLASHCL